MPDISTIKLLTYDIMSDKTINLLCEYLVPSPSFASARDLGKWYYLGSGALLKKVDMKWNISGKQIVQNKNSKLPSKMLIIPID